MALDVDPRLVAEFGSATRVLTLAALANAFEPVTAYRVAQLVQTRRTKVYAELSRLERSGVVRSEKRTDRSLVWRIDDADVAALLRKRARISWGDDLLRERKAWLTRNPEAVDRILNAPVGIDWKRFEWKGPDPPRPRDGPSEGEGPAAPEDGPAYLQPRGTRSPATPSPMRTSEEVGRALEAEPRRPDRTLAFVALLGHESGLGDRLVVVGGSAIEIHTSGRYVSDDIDVVAETGERERLASVLRSWGFRRSGHGWHQATWKLYVDLPPGPYHGLLELTRVVATRYGPVRVAAPEDLILRRLAMAKYWQEENALREGALLIAQFGPSLDWTYLGEKARREGVADLVPEVRKLAGFPEGVAIDPAADLRRKEY